MFNSNAKLFMTIIVIMGLIYLLQKQEVVSNEGEVDLRAEVEKNVEFENNEVETDSQEFNFDTETESVIDQVLDQRSSYNYRSREVDEPVKVQENMDNSNQVGEKDPIDSVFEEDITGGQESSVVSGNDMSAPSVFDKSEQEDITKKNMEKLMKENNEKKILFKADELLPNDVNKDWFETDFTKAKVRVDQDNLINTERYVVGVNTVGQSLKNASYDLRAAPPNPKVTVSPWNQSSIEPDYNIRPLM
jgi:hypothetical protein